ncbi:MAG: DUF4468 domain-containing protein [Prevotellaceae bacterium]|jgi:hypothetical protein|nr:DUF4468 domain-containing protein [Prevotellaceae bacterium]
MKKVLFIALVCVCSATFAQQPISYSKVIQTDSVGKDALFASINEWFASTYNSAKDVLQMTDKDAGIIVGNGNTKYSYGGMIYSCYEGWLKYSIKVNVKDNRYKVEITNISHSNKQGNAKNCELGLVSTADEYATKGASKSYHNKVWNDIKQKMEAYAEKVFVSMENHTKDVKNINSDNDW